MHPRATIFIIFFVFFVSVYSAVAFYSTTPKPSQPFIAFGVYSSQGALSGYAGSNSTVTINQPIDWTFHITNEMGSTQFIEIVSRIGNNTSAEPNATAPAQTPALANSTFFVPDGQSSIVEFAWKVLSVTTSGGLNYLSLSINGKTVSSTVGAPPRTQFRFFFELWTFDEPYSSFRYGWQGAGPRESSWLQVWFYVST